MKKQISLENREITYTLRKSKRAKRMRLTVYCDGAVAVTTPHNLRTEVVEQYIRDKAQWLFSKLAFFASFHGRPIARRGHEEYVRYKQQAQSVIEERVEFINRTYGFSFNSINIKNQKTRWGSCSKKGNLNFNYKLLFLPDTVRDYVVAHELCHLAEFSHSKKFWALVAKWSPNHAEVRKMLRDHGLRFV